LNSKVVYKHSRLVVVVYAYNFTTKEVGAGEFCIHGERGLLRKNLSEEKLRLCVVV
jgi:hypothetical protein